MCLFLTGCGSSQSEETASDLEPIEITNDSASFWGDSYTTDGVLESGTANANAEASESEETITGSGATIMSGTDKEVDVDISALSVTMAYAEVYAMTAYPDEYLGKTVKITGEFTTFTSGDSVYFVVLIMDETACCIQGIEFALEGDFVYPNDYPVEGETITVVGTYSLYEEDGVNYIELADAVMIEN